MRIIIIQPDTEKGRTHTYLIKDSETMEILDNLIHKLSQEETSKRKDE